MQDLLVYAIGFATLAFILRNEERPLSIIGELIAFCFFNAAVFENFATVMGLYGYGRSLLMVFNVPLSVPLVEWLVVYTTLRLLAQALGLEWGCGNRLSLRGRPRGPRDPGFAALEFPPVARPLHVQGQRG